MHKTENYNFKYSIVISPVPRAPLTKCTNFGGDFDKLTSDRNNSETQLGCLGGARGANVIFGIGAASRADDS